ncbi:tail fiber domain-containing protein [Pseudomonas cyclaminis]|uniref:tail fiber domain-containing protein n=1 Tax=Pseudomonas cyclaminis TaxID=2781239 RepID=UPI003809787B
MVWQRAGAVAVQNGSSTVVGTSVDFAASCRNGDSFVGPDGATYEVANVASATVISILPAYKGATVSGASYAIMPVQGYDKMLSDAFNALNNQFGPKIAALGTTGNYDILPVAKGGTGSSSLNALAKSGANTDITSLGGLSTALSIAQGGTGSKTQSDALTALGAMPTSGGSYNVRLSSVGVAGSPATPTNVQGSFTGWNAGVGGLSGEADFVCNRGNGTGGFAWWSVNLAVNASGPIMTYSYSGNLTVPGTVTQGSDRRLKTNDVEIIDGLEKILQMRPVEFDRRVMLSDKDYPFHESGFIAQELNEVLPILVTPGGAGDDEDVWRVNYTGLIPYLVSAIKAQQSLIDLLDSEIAEIKARPPGIREA